MAAAVSDEKENGEEFHGVRRVKKRHERKRRAKHFAAEAMQRLPHAAAWQPTLCRLPRCRSLLVRSHSLSVLLVVLFPALLSLFP